MNIAIKYVESRRSISLSLNVQHLFDCYLFPHAKPSTFHPTTSFDNTEFIFIREHFAFSNVSFHFFKALFYTATRYHVHFKLANEILLFLLEKAKVGGKKCLINVYCSCFSRLLHSFPFSLPSCCLMPCSNEGGNRIN